MTLFSLARPDFIMLAEPEVSAPLRRQAATYPDEATAVKSLHLSSHWAAYKKAMVRQSHAERAAERPGGKRVHGGRPPAKAAHSDVHVHVSRAVRRANYLCPDGTPISKVDVRDMQAQLSRRVEQTVKGGGPRHAPPSLEPKIAAYLATRPGGHLWRGNLPLRSYLAKKERRQHARSHSMPAALGARAPTLMLPSLVAPAAPTSAEPPHHASSGASLTLPALDDDGIQPSPSIKRRLDRVQLDVSQAAPHWEPPSLLPARFGKQAQSRASQNRLHDSRAHGHAMRARVGGDAAELAFPPPSGAVSVAAPAPTAASAAAVGAGSSGAAAAPPRRHGASIVAAGPRGGALPPSCCSSLPPVSSLLSTSTSAPSIGQLSASSAAARLGFVTRVS